MPRKKSPRYSEEFKKTIVNLHQNGKSYAEIEQEVRLQEWSAQIKAQKASGMTVRQWCVENGIKPATYYYHLRLLREQCLENTPAIVLLTAPQHSSDIQIEKNGLQISLPADMDPETLLALVRELC